MMHARRERVFLVLAATFIGAMAMLNIIGVTRFVHIGPLALAVGVLPYPLTFLCTDLIGELYGRARAQAVVWTGLGVNVLVIATLWVGHLLPPVDASAQPSWQTLHLADPVTLPDGRLLTGQVELFGLIYECTAASVLASMVAYLAAQFCDVYLFHFWKGLTRGRHLWLRNNGSTIVSQLVDAIAVISIVFGAQLARGDITFGTFLALLGSNYLFKFVAALADTPLFYAGVGWLSRYLDIDPRREHDVDRGV